MQIKFAVLVYQCGGIANVFAVSKATRKRLLQSDFRTCESFCLGLAAAGVGVRSAHCNKVGDVALWPWSTDLTEAPFRESMRPVRT